MKIHTNMPKALKPFFIEELEIARNYLSNKNFSASWHHPRFFQLVHWKMFLFGIRIKDLKEIVGQIPRLLVGGIKSFVGEIPIGNTGGSNVPPLQKMEIPAELQKIIDEHK